MAWEMQEEEEEKRMMSTADETKARMKDIFAGVCNTLGLKPLDVTLGRLCTVALPSAEQAEDLIESLKVAGEVPRVRHIDSKKDKLFDADEWLVSWGEL